MSASLLKKLASFAAFLVCLWAAYLYIQVPRQRMPFAKGNESAAKIKIQQGPAQVDLIKEAGNWYVLSGTGARYRADAERIHDLLSGLKDVQIEDEISNNPQRASDFEVDTASGTRVIILNVKGSSLVDGIFGKQAPDVSHIYFRFPDRAQVYLARGIIRGDIGKPELSVWRSRQMVDIPEPKILGVFIEGPGFKTDLVRVSSEAWKMNGKPVDVNVVNSLVGMIAHLHADNFVDPAASPKLTFEGLTYARIRIQGADTAVDFRIGAQDPKAKRYPASVGKDQGLVWISQATLDSVLMKPALFKPK